jgi:hypothetical protein
MIASAEGSDRLLPGGKEVGHGERGPMALVVVVAHLDPVDTPSRGRLSAARWTSRRAPPADPQPPPIN